MRRSVADISKMKGAGKISAVTSYDYTMATLCDAAGVDVLLVGDSAGMVVLGYESTVRVTMNQMCMFTEAVCRGRKNALVVGDLPFMSYQAGAGDAIRNSGRLVEAGADAVKLEGGSGMAGTVSGIVQVGIPVMGHIGLQPQTAALSGGYKIQGKTCESAMRLVRDARALEEAGAFCIVLEMVAQEAAQVITGEVGIPTIGIGSGAGCDGQVLVVHDLLGMYEKMRPKFAKRYLDLAGQITGAVKSYSGQVREGQFPAPENCFSMEGTELERLRDEVGR